MSWTTTLTDSPPTAVVAEATTVDVAASGSGAAGTAGLPHAASSSRSYVTSMDLGFI